MNKQEAVKFVNDHLEDRPYNKHGKIDNKFNYIHQELMLNLLNKIFIKNASQPNVQAE